MILEDKFIIEHQFSCTKLMAFDRDKDVKLRDMLQESLNTDLGQIYVPSGMMLIQGDLAELEVYNDNNRWYGEEHYLSKMNRDLLPKIDEGLLGELEHPDSFNINYNNVSHKIEKLWYDKDTKRVKGIFLLLDTPKGKIAQSIARSGSIIRASSRAAGDVDRNRRAIIEKMFTFDLVGTSGFNQAKLKEMFTQKVNESLSIDTYVYYPKNGTLNENLEDSIKKTLISLGISFNNLEIDNKNSLDETLKPNKSINKGSDTNNENNSIETMNKEVKEYIDGLLNEEKTKSKETINKLNESIANLTQKIETLEKENTTLNEALNKSIETNQTKINESIVAFNESLAETLTEKELQVENNFKSLNESLSNNGVSGEQVGEQVFENLKRWLNEEFAPVIQKWVTNDYTPVLAEGMQNWVVNDVAPEIQKWVFEDYSPEIQNWVVKDYTPTLAEGMQNWVFEDVAPKLNEFFGNKINESIQKSPSDLLSLIDTSLNENKEEYSKKLADEMKKLNENANNSKPNDKDDEGKDSNLNENLWLDKMPVEYVNIWNNLSEKAQEVVKDQASIRNNLNEEGEISKFWRSRDWDEIKATAKKGTLNEGKDDNNTPKKNGADPLKALMMGMMS